MKPVLKEFPAKMLKPGDKFLVVVNKTNGPDIEHMTAKTVELRGHSVIVTFLENPEYRFWYLDDENVKMLTLEEN